MTEKVDLDWANLGFRYRATTWRFQAEHAGDGWSEGGLTAEPTLAIAEGATALHYGQQCFEGLKAHAAPDGAALLFRPDRNAARFRRSAERLLMPPVPDALFRRAVRACVAANLAWLPPPGTGAALYVRPLLIGVGDNLGLRTAPRFVFRVFCAPVGPYFSGGLAPIRLAVTDYDRVAPRGTGDVKAGGNYAAGLLASQRANELGCDEALYLDPTEQRFVEEAGAANVFGLLPGDPDAVVTPDSPSVLPSVTMDSLLTIAREELGLTVARRPIALDELDAFRELGCTGTAAVITPIGAVRRRDGREVVVPEAPGPVTRALYERLVAIQTGRAADPRGWVERVE